MPGETYTRHAITGSGNGLSPISALVNKLQLNYNQISNISIDENAFENYVYKMSAV